MNDLYATTKEGTIGELIVQLRLLEHDIQAAPPLKDSGNDLIAIRRHSFRALQVRTTTGDRIDKPDNTVLYHILAVVKLPVVDGRFVTRDAEIFLFSRDEVSQIRGGLSRHRDHIFSQQLLDKMFDHDAV
jgi:hypothetical protein